MAGSILRGYTHKQTTASATWVINHGILGGNCATDVMVYISSELVKIIPKTVVTSGNTTTITFSTAYTGEAYVI